MSLKSSLEHLGKDAKKVDSGLQEAGKEIAKGQQTVQKYSGGSQVQTENGKPPVEVD